ncbi:hypothetical protein [Haloferula sp.]|uniref:hypothetical protein n=1 Tax=Haloferula sp. TaxID=2497595 RepID=UPI00329CCE06
MDKEKARFILSCFRPDGADAADPEFAAALQLAAADRELGEWLAKERSQDAQFADMLGKLPLPDDLREEIMAGLAAERGDRPETDGLDASLIGALATVHPPAELKSEILAAMQQSAQSSASESASTVTPFDGKKSSGSSWWRFGLPLAAAAGIALAFVVGKNPSGSVTSDGPDITSSFPSGQALPVSFVQEQSIAAMNSGGGLDLRSTDHEALFEYVREAGSPCAAGCLPEGLIDVDGKGCRVIEIDGRTGAIICFERTKNETVHLVVFRRADVSGELPGGSDPMLEQKGKWATARWEEGNRVFVLMGKTDTEHLRELF